MLGPLEVTYDGQTLPLGGVKQRATLAYLLLHAGEVVPTSRLLDALWPSDDPPMSAKKMLQNAVWSLRMAFEAAGCSREEVSLSTRSPGYVLSVPRESVDLFQFQQQAEAGSQALADGQFDRAASVLRAALSSWRGTALADLTESGIDWPRLSAASKLRLDALEDMHDADLRCGRHRAALPDLERLVEQEPLRERASALLMLALYRSGRQADALAVYSELRASLVDGLGLEPGPELRRLQTAILSHDATLLAEADDTTSSDGGTHRARPDEVADAALAAVAPARRAVRQPIDGTTVPASVLVLRMRPTAALHPSSPEARSFLKAGTVAVREVAERLGGRVVSSMGYAMALEFDGRRSGSATPARAVEAALNLRDTWSRAGSHERGSHGAGARVSAVVVTDLDHLALPTEHEASGAADARIDRGMELLNHVPDADVWICERTQQLTGDDFLMSRTHGPSTAWTVKGARSHRAVAVDVRSHVLVLDALLGRATRLNAAHLVTVIDDPGTDVARLLDEFTRAAGAGPAPVRVVRARARAGRDRTAPTVQTQILRSFCEVEHSDDLEHVRGRLISALGELDCSTGESDHLLRELVPLAQGDLDECSSMTSWTRLLELLSRRRPLVVLVEDLHHAPDGVLDALERLAERTNASMLLVLTGESSLIERQKRWADDGAPGDRRALIASTRQGGAAARVPGPSRAPIHLGYIESGCGDSVRRDVSRTDPTRSIDGWGARAW